MEKKPFDEAQCVQEVLQASKVCKEIYEERNRAAEKLMSARETFTALLFGESTPDERRKCYAEVQGLKERRRLAEGRLDKARSDAQHLMVMAAHRLAKSRGLDQVNNDHPWVCHGPTGKAPCEQDPKEHLDQYVIDAANRGGGSCKAE